MMEEFEGTCKMHERDENSV